MGWMHGVWIHKHARTRVCTEGTGIKGLVRDLAWLMFEIFSLLGFFLLRDWERIRFWDYPPVE